MSRERYVLGDNPDPSSDLDPCYVPNADGTFPAYAFMDGLQTPFDDHYIDITDEEITVPDSGLVELDFVPAGDPRKSSVLVVDDGDTTTLSPVVGSTAITTGQVRVYPGRPYLDFNTSLAGSTFYATYKASHSTISGTVLSKICREISAITSRLVSIDTAMSEVGLGEVVTALSSTSFEAAAPVAAYDIVTMTGTTTPEVEPANVTSSAYCVPLGMATDAGDSEDPIPILHTGFTTHILDNRAGIPAYSAVYLSKTPGKLTWDGDTNAAYEITESYPLYYVGFHICNGRGFINPHVPIVRGASE